MHRSCKSVSDGEHCVIIVLVVSLILRGEAVAHVRILYVVATTTQISTCLPLPRLWTCRSSSALIIHLSTTQFAHHLGPSVFYGLCY